MFYSTFISLALLPLALALPVAETENPANVLQKRSTYCGSHYYSDNAIYNAANAACNYLSQGTTAGGSTYPHKYNDYEGFTFDGTPGPYYEFPILSSGKVYSGGSPGADRVIINYECDIAGEITHTGASSTNGFVACSGTN